MSERGPGRRLTGSRLAAALLLLALLPALLSPAARAEEADRDKRSWNVRYAVCIYGIRQDRYENCGRKRAGLTFGPATGESWADSYRAHVSQTRYDKDPVKNRCLHWMSWAEIIAQCAEDPTVFQCCMEYGCTHAVELCLNDTLLEEDCSFISGDGAGALLNCLKPGFRCWNQGGDIRGGWPACRMRAVLNGADERTDGYVAGEDFLLEPEESLFSCFPEELRESIVPKAVVSDLAYDLKKGRPVTTYDKLWLFSAIEIHGNGFPLAKRTEGSQYQRNVLRPCKPSTLPDEYRMFSEHGGILWAWLRSASDPLDVMNYHIFGGGHGVNGEFFNFYGVAPGFCLP